MLYVILFIKKVVFLIGILQDVTTTFLNHIIILHSLNIHDKMSQVRGEVSVTHFILKEKSATGCLPLFFCYIMRTDTFFSLNSIVPSELTSALIIVSIKIDIMATFSDNYLWHVT